MQKTPNPNNFMNEMHENEFKSFSHFLPSNFQPMNIFCIKIIEYIILDGQTKFTHNFMC